MRKYNHGYGCYFQSFNGTIYGYENSTAQAYSEKYEKNFVSLGQVPKQDDINIADAVLLQKYILGRYEITEKQFKKFDLNGDGYVDSFDMVLIRKKIINK